MGKQNQRERLENIQPHDLETKTEAELVAHLEKVAKFLELKKQIQQKQQKK
jgi:hypothetical protein